MYGGNTKIPVYTVLPYCDYFLTVPKCTCYGMQGKKTTTYSVVNIHTLMLTLYSSLFDTTSGMFKHSVNIHVSIYLNIYMTVAFMGFWDCMVYQWHTDNFIVESKRNKFELHMYMYVTLQDL